MQILKILALLLFALSAHQASCASEVIQFADKQQEQRFNSLIVEFRCLVCQNQSLADSDADLARDLRRKTLELLNEGRSDPEIRAFMQERYGDFVLYRTPFTQYTAVLWVAPLLILLVLGWFVVQFLRRPHEAQSVTEEQLQRARDLIRDD